MTASLLPFLMLMLPVAPPEVRETNWCAVGQSVIIPDGRDGPVTFIDGDYCGVLPYGEKYATRWAFFLIEPEYRRFGR